MSKGNWLGVWVDTETTGFDPHTGDRLLEVACFVTDSDGNLLEPNGYHSVVQYAPEEVIDIKNNTVPYVLNMHETSGLWNKLPEGKPLNIIEDELFNYISNIVGESKKGRLAGNSVRLDFNFLDYFLPKVTDYLHYRVIDVSTLRAVADEWLEDFQYDKATPHEALADIKLSINEYLLIKEALGL